MPSFGRGLNKLHELVNWRVFDDTDKQGHIHEIGYLGVCRWFKNGDESYRTNRSKERMAEFLIENEVDFNLIECIVVFNESIKRQIESWEEFRKYNIPVYVKPKYF